MVGARFTKPQQLSSDSSAYSGGLRSPMQERRGRAFQAHPEPDEILRLDIAWP